MRHLVLLVLSFAFLTHNSNSQNYSHEYGKVTLADFEYVFKEDPDADAVILYDIGDSRFISGTQNAFDLKFERRTKIKINTRAGMDWAEVHIPIYKENNQYEKITELKAITYNLENGILHRTTLEKANIYEEKVNENWYVKKFAMPNVKEGSVIEFTYTVISPYLFNLRDWEFQSTIPVAYSRYETRMIPFYEYTFLLQGASKFDEYEAYKSKDMERSFGSINFQDYVYIFAMKNVKPFQDIDFITSKNDFLIKLDFQLAAIHRPFGADIEVLTTWLNLVEELNKNYEFGKFVDKSKKYFEKEVSTNSYENTTGLDRLTYGVEYVKSNYKWDGNYGKYSSKDFKEFEREKSGNSGCINLFLTGVLQGLGFEAYPVILSTRENGKIISEYPFPKFFNYVVVLVTIDGKQYISDATELLNPAYRIPIKCINDVGLIIKEGEVQWINLYPAYISKTRKEIKISIEDEEKEQIDFKLIATEYDGLYYRKNYFNDTDELNEYVKEKEIELTGDIHTENLTEVEKPYTLSFSGYRGVEKFDGKLYISPFLKEPVQENPFTQKERKYPVDLIYPKSRSFKSTVQIPEGYELKTLPKIYKTSNDMVDVHYSIKTENENEIIVEGWYTFNNGIYAASDYDKLKYYYMEIIKTFNQKLELVKKIQ